MPLGTRAAETTLRKTSQELVIPIPTCRPPGAARLGGRREAQTRRASIYKGGPTVAERLTDRSVSRIVKVRLRQLAIASGRSAADADKLAAAFSSHSLRAGFATTDAEHDAPGYRIQSHMRHRSMDTTGGYIRAYQQ